MEITASIALQSNKSCEVKLDKKPEDSILSEYYLYDLELTPTISLNSDKSIRIEETRPAVNDIKGNYEIYGYQIYTEINSRSEVVNEILKNFKYIIGNE